jgi:hypothetical protein
VVKTFLPEALTALSAYLSWWAFFFPGFFFWKMVYAVYTDYTLQDGLNFGLGNQSASASGDVKVFGIFFYSIKRKKTV